MKKEEILALIEQDSELRKKIIDLLYREMLEVVPTRADLVAILKELKNQREDTSHRFEQVDKKFETICQELKQQREDTSYRFEQADKRFETICEELKQLRGDTSHRFEQVDKRFETICQELKQLREDTNRRFEQVDKRFEAIYQELKQLREDTNRRFEQVDKRFETICQELKQLREDTNRRFEDVYRRFEQIDKRFEAIYQELKQLREDTNRRFEEMNKRLEELRKDFHIAISTVGSRWGPEAEEVFRASMREILEKYYKVHVKECFIEDDECIIKPYKARYQVDLLITDNVDILVEIKAQANDIDVVKLHKLGQIYYKKTNRKPRLILVAIYARPEAKEEIKKLSDVEIITRPEDFRPCAFI